MHEAKTHLSSLIEKAVQGESFIISKAGKPLVRVTRVEAPTQTTGFLQGQMTVPDDFDAMGAKHIATLFAGTKWRCSFTRVMFCDEIVARYPHLALGSSKSKKNQTRDAKAHWRWE